MEEAEEEKKNEGGGDVCLATMLTSLTTAGPGSYAHTHTHTHTNTHTLTQGESYLPYLSSPD